MKYKKLPIALACNGNVSILNKEYIMRELLLDEVRSISGGSRWSVNGMGAINPNRLSYGGFNIGYNINNQGISASANINVARIDGKTHWGDRGIMVGVTKKW